MAIKNINFKNTFLPHFIAILVFVVITVFFFAPVFFEGKILPQHDITQAKGGAQEIMQYRTESQKEILWTNSMFSGMPSYLLGIKYSSELTIQIHKLMSLYLPHPVSLIFLAFINFYIMLLIFGVRPWLAIAGALVFGLTDFSIIGLMAGHNSKIAAIAFIPLVLAGIHLAFDKNIWKGMILTSLGLALQIRTNHLQITYYLLLIVSFYGLYQLVESIRKKTLPDFIKTASVLMIAVLIAVGCNFGKLWTVMEYSKYSTRGKTELTTGATKESGLDREYVFRYSNGIIEPLFLFIPNFMGGSNQEDLGKNSNLEKALKKNGMNRQQIKQQVENAPAYWGNQPLTAPYYGGAIMVFLFVLGLFVLDGKLKYWLTAAAVLGIVLSWGNNFPTFNNLFYDYFPGYNKFRSVTFTIIITVFCMTLIGFQGLEKIFQDSWNRSLQKNLLKALSIVGGFALLCIIFANIGPYKGAIDARLADYPSWYLSALRADRATLLRMDAFRSLFFVLAFVTTYWLFTKGKISKSITYSLIILLISFDMIGVAKRFISFDSFKKESKNTEHAPSEADQRILQDTDPHFRVMNLQNPFNDAMTSFHHKSVGGYHGAKMGRYQNIISNGLSQEHSQIISALQNNSMNFGSTPVTNMLNTKYFIAGSSANAVLSNASPNGNAWFITDLIRANGPDEEITMLKTLDSKNSAVIDQTLFETSELTYTKDSTDFIELSTYHPEQLTYLSKSKSKALAVFSEIYYPKGWNATIDGKSTSILRVNHVLRALELPAGEHTIEFSFAPKSFNIGQSITLAFNILLILLLIGFIGFESKNLVV